MAHAQVPLSLLVREGDAIGMRMSVIRLQDRRAGALTQPIEWTFQKQVEIRLLGGLDARLGEASEGLYVQQLL